MPEEYQRQRAMRQDVGITRQALAVVLPINRRIGDWQASAVKLLAIGRKLTAARRSDPRVRAEAENLLEMVRAERRMLDERKAALPPAVARSTLLLDTVRALDSVSNGLEQALELLQASGSSPVSTQAGLPQRDPSSEPQVSPETP